MNPDHTEDEIIARDQQTHPDCQYSVNFSQVCSSHNGDMVCETIRNLQRYCPGQRPVTIYSKKDQYKGNNEDMEQHALPSIRSFDFRSSSSSSGSGSGNSQGHPNEGFGGLFDSFKMMDDMMGGFASDMLGRFAEDIQKEIISQFPQRADRNMPPNPQLPPHKLPSQSEQQQPKQPPTIFAPWGGLLGTWPSGKPEGDSAPPKIPGRVTGPVEEI